MSPSDPTRTGAEDPDATRVTPSSGVHVSVPGTGGLLQPGQRVSNRYTIVKLLGSGGMGSVYQAWDDELGSPVALKLVRLDTATDPFELRQLEDRFRRELKLARQVTHPNVVRIHDIGEIGESRYLTMAYVQGADLASVIAQDGRLPPARAISIATQIASGLAAAHRAGVVHRDLKPANVMITGEGQALLTDFGIAKSTTSATLHTAPGAILGTLDYMAPEQASHGMADERTDVFAFGLILHEMLTGRRARGGGSASLPELLARIQRTPPPVRAVAADVPEDLERIVARCVHADPAARYQSAGELLKDLEQLGPDGHRIIGRPARPRWAMAGAGAALAATLVGGTYWVTGGRAPATAVAPAAREPISVLVADFDNRAQEPVFQGSLEQALGLALEGAPFITAYSRGDAAAVAHQIRPGATLDEPTARLVANREGVRLILAGAIDRAGDGYRIAVSALDPARAEPVARAEASAASKAQVLGAIQTIAERIRTALGDTSPSTEHQAETFTTSSLEAVRSYMRAQELSSNQKDEDAIVHYREAVAHDPQFGRAYAGWASSALYLGRRAEAEDLWKRALALMERMTEREKFRTLGGYYLGVAGNYDKAIENYTLLVERYPADLAGHNNLALAHFYSLNFPKALEHGRKAIEIYPRSAKFRANFALYAMYAGDFAASAQTARELLKDDPSFETAYLPLAVEAVSAGRIADARQHYAAARANGGAAGASLAAVGEADLALYEGRPAEALRILEPAISKDLEDKNVVAAAAKIVAKAEAALAAGDRAAAQAATKAALSTLDDDSVIVSASNVLIQAARASDARRLVAGLGERVAPRSRAYGKLLEGELLMADGRFAEAIVTLQSARDLANLWLVRYALGLAYFHARQFPEALSEFDTCHARHGEASAVFLDDVPTVRYLAPLTYWRGRAQEEVGLRGAAAESYGAYVDLRGSADGARDPWLGDVRARLASLQSTPP